MLNNKGSHYLSNYLIVFVSLMFAIFVGFGFYGYGNDFYAVYKGSNLKWGGTFDRLGFIIATLTIYGVHLGVQVTSFLLSLSSGLLIREHVKFKDSYSFIFFIVLYLMAIHTWPIIMSTSNAMRQGLAMSFVFLSLIANSRKNYYWMIFFSILSTLMHKSGLIFVMIIFFSNIVNNLLHNVSHIKKALMNFIIGLLLLYASYQALGILGFVYEEGGSRIIGADFRWAFVTISFIYIGLSFFFKNILSNSLNLSLYYFSFISLSFLLNGLNWQYERLGMVMLIPYILSFGILLNRPSYKIYLILIFVSLLWLTVLSGMYASLK